MIWNQRYSSSRRVNDFNPPQCTTPSHSAAVYSTKSPFVTDVTVSLSETRGARFTFADGAARFSSLSFSAEGEAKRLSDRFRDEFLHTEFFGRFLGFEKTVYHVFPNKDVNVYTTGTFSIRWDHEGTEEHCVSCGFLRIQQKSTLIIKNLNVLSVLFAVFLFLLKYLMNCNRLWFCCSLVSPSCPPARWRQTFVELYKESGSLTFFTTEKEKAIMWNSYQNRRRDWIHLLGRTSAAGLWSLLTPVQYVVSCENHHHQIIRWSSSRPQVCFCAAFYCRV